MLAVVCLLLLAREPRAQEVTPQALKAAFIYTFVKFTTWPETALPAGAPLLMCVLGDDAVGDALSRATAGRMLEDHPLEVARVAAPGALDGCSLLYLSNLSAGRAGQVVSPVADVPVLTISDIAGFNDVGGIAQFHYQQGQLRFNVNIEASRRAGLQISSRLLLLIRRP